MNIGIDMMGGDYAPFEAVKGIALYLAEAKRIANLTLIGDKEKINRLLTEHQISSPAIAVEDAPQVIEMHEHPTKALKAKPQSSIATGFKLLSSGKTNAFISAGNTGAMMVGALFSIKTIEGVSRPTIGAYMPRENGKLGLLLDAGINSDCKPENLNQFATLGSLFAEHILEIENPRVGLINIGEEEGKGNLLVQAAFPLLKANESINFTGNIEGRDILLNNADVMVCDGFTGNVILKFAESIFDITQRRNINDEHFDRFNFEAYGGVPILGISMPVIIGHGISHAAAFKNMILIAQRMIEKDLMQKMKDAFSEKKKPT